MRRPAERVARVACLGAVAGEDIEGVVAIGLLYDIQTNRQAGNWPMRRRRSGLLCLAIPAKILIRRSSVDPGRELNGRSQQLTR